MATIMNDLVANGILLIGGIIMAFFTSWKLSVLSICVIPPVTFMYRRYAKWAKKVNRSIWQAYGDANSVATETISNIRTVRAFAAEDFELGRYDQGVNVAFESGSRAAYVGAALQAFSSYMNLLTSVLILWYGGIAVMDTEERKKRGERPENDMTFGGLIAFQLYWNLMNSSFLTLSNVFNELIRASSAAERVFQIMDVKPNMPVNEGIAIPRGTMSGDIMLEGVQFNYLTRPDNKVLKGIDLHMRPGTTTALVGKSGGGKSTIIHLLLRFYDPSAGVIKIDGIDLKELNATDVRKHIGFVAQDTQLFATSILENLLYALDDKDKITKDEVIEACKMANAHEFIWDMEEKYETRVGEKGIMLSGGQKQRLALARCFLRKPKLLFLDEATSALDAENEALVQEGIDRLLEMTQCTVLLIAHRLSTVMHANQIAVINGGLISELGTHDTLVKEGGIYAKLVSRQMKRDENVINEANLDLGATGSSGSSPSASPPGKSGKGKGKGKKGGGAGTGASVGKTEIDELFESIEGNGEKK